MKFQFLIASSTSLLIFSGIAGGCNRPVRQVPLVDNNKIEAYTRKFSIDDSQSISNYISDSVASTWIINNVPLFECPDERLEKTYYFRWWTYRKHIKQTPSGFVVTEFLPNVSWSKKYNTINCPAGHHFYEGRWIRNREFLDDYGRFYFSNEGDPGGTTKMYSNWLTDGVYARFLVNIDTGFVTSLLTSMVKDFRSWGKDGPHKAGYQQSRQLPNGLYWQIDSWEGTEYSISGTGIKPMTNSYLYANAYAISQIADLAGQDELAEAFRVEASRLRQLIERELWDSTDSFFKTKRHSGVPENQYANDAAEVCEPGRLVGVKELFGYVPWYFHIPSPGIGYEKAWQYLADSSYFHAPYGLTVAEKSHPKFHVNDSGCMWRGASWPFSTSQTLTALANVLNDYDQSVIDRRTYFDLLTTYARSHVKIHGNGTSISWIDESLNPFTGEWIPTDGNPPRGIYYNHSTFCDLVITGLVGLRPQPNNKVVVNPLVPDDQWDYFCLSNIQYHGKELAIVWDKTGKKYGVGKGLILFVDGKKVAAKRSLGKIEAIL